MGPNQERDYTTAMMLSSWKADAVKNVNAGSRGIVQQLRMHTTFAEDPGSVCRSYMRQLTIANNSRFKEN